MSDPNPDDSDVKSADLYNNNIEEFNKERQYTTLYAV